MQDQGFSKVADTGVMWDSDTFMPSPRCGIQRRAWQVLWCLKLKQRSSKCHTADLGSHDELLTERLRVDQPGTGRFVT